VFIGEKRLIVDVKTGAHTCFSLVAISLFRFAEMLLAFVLFDDAQ
jgi:hypothetical protein